MRTAALLALLALVVATLACGSEPPPSCGAIGRSAPCACPGGAQGAQECGPQGVWGVCACPDGGALEAGADGGADAGRESGVDRDAVVTPVDVDPGCDGGAPTRCGGACIDLNHDGANCGACGRACAGVLSECVFGVCQVPLGDGGAG